MAADVTLDCDAGRRLGCNTFCCRLIVRLREDEREPSDACKNCVDKDLRDGFCVHLDRETHRCGIWSRRPAVCRAYDCNRDPLLAIVLRDGFTSLVALVTSEPPPADVPPARIPYVAAET